MNNTRKTWIDIARIFCMLIIIVGHMPCYEKVILEYLTTFHVAIFFILSGVLYHPQDFFNEVVKSFKSLIIPYIILGFVNIGYWGGETYINDTSLTSSFVDYFIQLITASIGLPMIGPLWFLVVLFLLRVSFVKLKDDKQILAINILSIIAAVSINHFFKESLFYAPVNIFLAIPFFSFGYIIQKTQIYGIISVTKVSTTKYLVSALVFFMLSFILFLFQGGNNMSKHDFGNNIITFYLCALFGALGIINLSLILQTSHKTISSWLYIANNGLPLMIGLQIMMIDMVKRVTHIYAFHIYEAIIFAVIILLSIIPITVLCMKHCSWVIGRK